jgi:hypothetical protein
MRKQLRIVIGINSLTASQWPAYNNHIKLFYRLGRAYPDIDFMLINPSRVSIDKMRNMAAVSTIKNEFDYLWFIDDDVMIPLDTLERLLACEADVAAASVIIRGYPFNFMAFRYTGINNESLEAMPSYPKDEGAVINVDAVGFSCCLIKRQILEKVPEPWFLTGGNHTEDIYFCLNARDVDPNCTIKVDTSIDCEHILWPETISQANKDNYKEYFEKQNPSVLKTNQITNLKVVKVDQSKNYSDIFKQSIGLGR